MIEIFGDHISADRTPIAYQLAEQYKQDVMRVRVGAGESISPEGIIDLLFDRQENIIDAIGHIEARIARADNE